MTISALPKPLHRMRVQKDWLDYNGHMNDAYYALVFSRSVDRFMDAIGMETHARTKEAATLYTLTLTVHYLHEALEGDDLVVEGRVLEHDDKRVRLWLSMTRGESGDQTPQPEIAQSEQILLCVSQSGDRPRAARFPPRTYARLQAALDDSQAAPWPKAAGRGVSLKKREA